MNAVKGSAETGDDSTASLANPTVARHLTRVDEPAQPDADNADADDPNRAIGADATPSR